VRIGMIVDGEAEYRSLSKLFSRIQISSTLLSPLKADIQPLAPVTQIAGAVKSRLKILAAKNVDLAIVLLDRESRPDCCGAMAEAIRVAITKMSASPRVAVVIKNRMFENWLIADCDALEQLRARFTVRPGQRQQIAPDKADSADGVSLLKAMVRQKDYNKVKDAVRIMSVAIPERLASNSRSFRRFLRILGHPAYRLQSRRSINPP